MKKILLLIMFLTACSTNNTDYYNNNEIDLISTLEIGKILRVRQIVIKNNDVYQGAIIGSIIGGVAGSIFGKGKGKIASSLGGAITGGIIGIISEKEFNNIGYEYIIKINNKNILIVQKLSEYKCFYKKGDNVLIKTTGDNQRIISIDDLPKEFKKSNKLNKIDFNKCNICTPIERIDIKKKDNIA